MKDRRLGAVGPPLASVDRTCLIVKDLHGCQSREPPRRDVSEAVPGTGAPAVIEQSPGSSDLEAPIATGIKRQPTSVTRGAEVSSGKGGRCHVQ